MTAYVFVGPSLSAERASEELEAVYLPPAAQGDIHRVLRRQPSLIGIVDGFFERVPAVWHKEILWALDQGVPVLGAASMGALRAAELDVLGMEGVGRIYEAYRDGELEDDDEVAVAHALAEDGYRVLSEAMVSIRRTLADAAAAGVVSAETRRLVVDAAKSLFYAERTYPAALAVAADAGADPGELDRLRRWLAAAAVDQKAEDALALLRVMRRRLAQGRTSVATDFTFERTDFWYEAQRSAGELPLDQGGRPDASLASQPSGDSADDRAATEAATVTAELLLDELRLDPDRYRSEWAATVARVNALDHARRAGVLVSDAQHQATADAFRRERGLHSPESARAWRAANDLSHEQAAALMHQEALVRWSQSTTSLPVAEALPDQLRVDGTYPELAERARDKARRLAARGLDEASLADLGVSWPDLLAWYVRERLGAAPPDDPAAFAVAHGYADEAHLRRTLIREYAYVAATRSAAADGPSR